MVDEDIAADSPVGHRQGIRDEAVLRAMRAVPRERFVHESQRDLAYADHPLPIGYDQTISQPYIVAFMTEAARLLPTDRVLEIGTGSGYQAAVLAEIADQVYSIEIVRPLGERAAKRLRELGYDNIHVRIGDGYAGWPEEAPFDAILVTAAPDHVPPALLDQLKPGGRMVIPVGDVEEGQSLMVLTKAADGTIMREDVLAVRFVPMLGEGTPGGEPDGQ